MSDDEQVRRRGRPRRERVGRPRDGGRWGFVTAAFAGLATVSCIAVAVAGQLLSAPPAVLAVAVVFLPYLFGGLVALLLCAVVLFPARRTILVWLLVSVAAGLALWGPRWRSGAAPSGTPVRMMSWNVRRLWGIPSDEGDAARCVAEAVAAERPDVLTLLEVSANDVAALSQALGLTCVHHAYTSDGDATEGGLATCVRSERFTIVGEGQRFVDDDDWYYVSSEVSGDGRRFNVLAVHLFPYRTVAKTIERTIGGLARGDTRPAREATRRSEELVRSQADQSAALLERVERFRDPTIIGGDFNSTRDSALHTSLRSALLDAWEAAGSGIGASVFLFDRIPLRIDYVYVTSDYAVTDAAMPATDCSDHRPVLTDLVLR